MQRELRAPKSLGAGEDEVDESDVDGDEEAEGKRDEAVDRPPGQARLPLIRRDLIRATNFQEN